MRVRHVLWLLAVLAACKRPASSVIAADLGPAGPCPECARTASAFDAAAADFEARLGAFDAGAQQEPLAVAVNLSLADDPVTKADKDALLGKAAEAARTMEVFRTRVTATRDRLTFQRQVYEKKKADNPAADDLAAEGEALREKEESLGTLQAAYDAMAAMSDRFADEIRVARITIDSFEGRLDKTELRQRLLRDELTAIKADMISRPVLSPADVSRMVEQRLERMRREAEASGNKDTLDSEFFHTPRIDARLSRMRGFSWYFSLSEPPMAVSQLLAKVGVEANAGMTWTTENHYGVEISVAARDLMPIFRYDGAATRRFSVMCVVFRGTTLLQNTHVGGGADVPIVPFVHVGGGASESETTSVDARATSVMHTFTPGTNVMDAVKFCQDYRTKFEGDTPILTDTDTMLKALDGKLPPPPTGAKCMRDFDCSNEVDGAAGVGECVRQPNGAGICRPRLVEGGSCYGDDYTRTKMRDIRSGSISSFMWDAFGVGYSTDWRALCARGLTCAASGECVVPTMFASDVFPSRPGQLQRNATAALASVKLREVKPLRSLRWAEAKAAAADAAICAKAGLPADFRLPTKYELFAVATYDRETLRSSERKIRWHQAYQWYYPSGVFSNAILGAQSFGWIRASESAVELPSRGLSEDVLQQLQWSVYCVR